MPSKADASKKIPLAEIEKDFHTFFEECSKLNNFQRFQVLFPLKYRKWRSLALKYGVLVLIVVFLLFIGFYVDFFAWHLAAVGRISLGQLKSVWQWEDLYKAKCLVGRPFNEKSEEKVEEEERGSFIDFKDCAVCENIDKIPRISNISYHHLHDKYLLRGHPLIISDSHLTLPSSDLSFASYLLNLPDLLFSKPCELQTNLLYKSTDLRTLFSLVALDTDDEFFLHFRNCDFEAVKASRAFIQKPYFYSPHLEPPYTSWLLLSQNYETQHYKKLSLMNLVIVQQLKGSLDVEIEAKDACFEVCGRHHVQVAEGEAMILMSKLWSFKYLPSTKDLSVTVVTETHFL